MKEIGGYFGLEEFSGKEYHVGLVALNSARNALLYLLRVRNIKKIYLPRFLCDSVSQMCACNGYEYEFYSIDQNFLPVFDSSLGPGEYLYVVNFYGQITNDVLKKLQMRYKNIIFDNVHAFFQSPVEDIDTIYSCRKFFGVPDGAYLATCASSHIENLDIDISKDRMKHVLGRYECTASEFYSDYKSNDESYSDLELRKMSKLTRNLLRGIDYDAVKNRRTSNYKILSTLLGLQNGLVPICQDGPYAYPFYVKNGMEVKKKLAERKIYVATLWPNVLDLGSSLEKDYAENILPLPCDQRYGEKEMVFVAEEVKKCIV